MDCPHCGSKTRVVDSRPIESGIFRRRRCHHCDTRFSTKETVLRVVKPTELLTVEQEVEQILNKNQRLTNARRELQERRELADIYGDHFG